MAVPLIDLTRQYKPIRAEIDAAVKKVLDHSWFILGPEVKKFEEDVASYTGAKHAIGVTSGTDALLIALRACGVKPGDEVITSSFSFFASAGVISRLGAIPVFADIEADTYNLDPVAFEEAITPKTKAVLPIHLFGQCADMDPILDVASEHNVKVIEDAAQAIGARYKNRSAGTIGDAGCFSFFPTKNLGCAGDGGMIITNDDSVADMARMLRVHGGHFEYQHKLVGYNARLDTMQAAILATKLPHLKAWTEKRRENANRYDTALAGLPLVLPLAKDWSYHIYNQYTIATPERDKLAAFLGEKQIGHKVYYPVPFHMQECFASLNYHPGDFPVSEKASREVLSIPIFGELTETEQTEVIEAIREFFGA